MIKNKPELVSPAGNFEKLKFAVIYGADTVFFGGPGFNLRDKAGNFSFEEIQQAIDYCKEKNVNTTFLLNSFLHENQIDDVKKYITNIENFDFTSVMISDPGMLSLVKKSKLESKIYLSTQSSTLNRYAVEFWNNAGIDRIVLGRETTLDDIKSIRDYTDAELEVFVHGALCISYSGRCLLSRFMSGRDANLGACSQPCRWKFSLMEEKRHGHHLEFIEHSNATEILSSKDLCLLKQIPEYIKAGVNAFKLEGRMKSLYYVANVTRIYRDLIDKYFKNDDYKKLFNFYESELDLISHRPYTEDLFNEFENLEFEGVPYIKNTLFTGYVDQVIDERTALVRIFNPIRPGEVLESISPLKGNEINDSKHTVIKIFEEDKEEDIARPNRICKMVFDSPIRQNAIFRKRINRNEE